MTWSIIKGGLIAAGYLISTALFMEVYGWPSSWPLLESLLWHGFWWLSIAMGLGR